MKLPETRWQAFLVHLALTCLLCIPLIIIAGYHWYPGILFASEGGLQGVIFLSLIIIPLGPGLILLTYVAGKKGLLFDIVFITSLQLLSIAYGLHVMFENRPGIVAYYSGSYYVIPILRFDSRKIDIGENLFFREKMPVFVNVRLPSNEAARLAVKWGHLFTGLETAIDLYEPYENAFALLKKEGLSIDEANATGITVPEQLAHKNIRIFNLVTRYHIYAMAVNTETGEPLKVLDVITSVDIPEK